MNDLVRQRHAPDRAVFPVPPGSDARRVPRPFAGFQQIDGWLAEVAGYLARRGIDHRLRRLEAGRLAVIEPGRSEIFGRRDAELSATVTIHDPRFHHALAFGGTVGAGESYAAGWWSTDDLVALIRLLARDQATFAELNSGLSRLSGPLRSLRHWLRPNHRAGARANIAAHYDLSNDFYALWLDETLSYSACVFASPDTTLEAAAIRKLDQIGDRLGLRAEHHLVEIGTGWGGLAIHLARRHGCRVTTTTISAAQHAEATARVRAAGLGDLVTVLDADYRDLPGRCPPADRLVSVEMIEAIGHAQYPTFFATCQRLLKPDGLALIQAITIPDRWYAAARGSVDFIKAHIFPGCNIPSLGALNHAMARASDLNLIALHDLTADYATTLRHWRTRFLTRWNDIAALGFDERFRRLWEVYLAYCEAGFRERTIGDAQLVIARPRWQS